MLGTALVAAREGCRPGNRKVNWPHRRLLGLTEFSCIIKNTTFNNGSLGSCNDEERSEMRNVMRFARICESSSL